MADGSEDTSGHPIWVLYDEVRTTCLNVKYYSSKLRELEKRNSLLDLIVAIAAPSSTVAGIWLFKTDQGVVLWSCITMAASIAATLKPILKYSEKIKSLQQTVAGYQALTFDLKEVSNKVRTDKSYSRTHIAAFEQAMRKSRNLLTSPPDAKNDSKLLDTLFCEVEQQFPIDNFYVPGVKHGGQQQSQQTKPTKTEPANPYKSAVESPNK